MKRLIKFSLSMGLFLLLTSCAIFPPSSLSPNQVNSILPTLTKSTFYSKTQAEEAVKSNRCKYLVKGRSYTAPIAFTAKSDLKNGAKGIDEWVEIDGGNAYTLISYKWVRIDEEGTTQLHLEFDTMLCE